MKYKDILWTECYNIRYKNECYIPLYWILEYSEISKIVITNLRYSIELYRDNISQKHQIL